MTNDFNPRFPKPLLPGKPCPNGGRFPKKSEDLKLGRKACKILTPWVPGGQQQLLTMQYWWVGSVAIGASDNYAPAPVDGKALQERRKRAFELLNRSAVTRGHDPLPNLHDVPRGTAR